MWIHWKRRLRNLAALASMLNGYWAFHMPGAAEQAGGAAVLAAALSAWACYFSVVWLVEGMRSGR
jgi:hypothetical protein